MKQPWIYSARVDGAFIIGPALITTALILLFRNSIAATQSIQPWMWGLLIVGVDVAHVYSTLYRTYADADELRARRTLYTLTPLLCWIVGTLLYSLGAIVFWRAIAYLAVFHFVRQQYGFMMIYARGERNYPSTYRRLDQTVIYLATLYPLIYWHTHMPRHFDWFVDGDFVALPFPALNALALTTYVLALGLYVAKEAYIYVRERRVNLPKNLLLLGTALSWWIGIIYFNNDLAFTAANVIAHGVPYMALIWIYGRNQGDMQPGKTLFNLIPVRRFFSLAAVPLFAGLLVLFAWCEEGLWDGMVWVEHKHIFAPFRVLPLIDDKATLAWLVPLLALPQTTHYVLDAFIWRIREKGTPWKEILFYRAQARS
ncbi:MAG TPA: hypothetical protein VL625_09320 [Patescibacteria group bacterium]|nr:hypothetical protein [Patescibacteria group bacterium]